MVPAMLRGEPQWPELRCYGVGWWIRSNETLRRLIEKVHTKIRSLTHFNPGRLSEYRFSLHK